MCQCHSTKWKFPIVMSALLAVGGLAAGTGVLQYRAQTARADSAATAKKTKTDAKQADAAATGEKAKVDYKALSYILGVNVAQSMQEQKLPLQMDEFMSGFRTAFAGKDSKYSDEEMHAVLTNFQKQKMEEFYAEQAKISEAAMQKGKDFLAKIKTNDGITQTASGLQYRVLEAGKGAKPTETDRVKVHYRGTLMDGTEFDSSYKRGEPVEFNVGGVIPGWTEALKMMSKGAKWELYIPAELAYGPRGAGGVIGPNEVLIFKVELLDVMNEEVAEPDSIDLSEIDSGKETKSN